MKEIQVIEHLYNWEMKGTKKKEKKEIHSFIHLSFI